MARSFFIGGRANKACKHAVDPGGKQAGKGKNGKKMNKAEKWNKNE
jgi:hypothetical protein